MNDLSTTTAALAAAKAKRAALIDRAIAGEPVDLGEHRAAIEAIEAAAQDVALASAIAEGQRLAAERASIASFTAQAEALKAKLRAAVAADAAAAVALDHAVTAAQAAAAHKRETGAALAELDRSAAAHNEELRLASGANGTLAAMHQSVWPKIGVAGCWQNPPLPLMVHLTLPENTARFGFIGNVGIFAAVARSAASLSAPIHQAVLTAVGAEPEAAA